MALYIGVAIVGFVLLGLATLLLVASRELDTYLQAREGALGRDAAAVLESGGPPALLRWMETPGTVPEGVAVYVLDTEGRDLAGKTLPSQYRSFVERFVLVGTRDEGQSFRPIRLAPLLVAPDGTRYAFLILPEGITPWGSPATLAALLAVALLVIAVVAALIARAFGRPITELQFAVRALAGGNIDARTPASLSRRDDELGVLARDVDTMATQLGGLLNSRQQLMRDMSHELRSPLARLQAALALADRKRPLPGAELARINLEIERMNQAIGDVLRFTRLEAAPLQAKHLLRIEDLLETLVADERDEAAAREIQLELLTVPDRVAQHVLEAAAKQTRIADHIERRHAPTGSKVLIDARTTDSTITVLIEDRGPGVPENMLERIFDPYVRLGGDTDDRTGTGLGLAIARRVFEAHDGRIAAERAAPSGLRVRIELARAC